MTELAEFVPGRIWLREYPVQYAGARFLARMTVLRLDSGKLLIHSPCGIDNSLHTEICGLGEVSYLVAPGTYHYFYIRPAQARYPNAQTYICPGIERKRPEIRFDWLLGDRSPPEWAGELEQILVHGTRFISEVAMFHKPTRTLLLVDLIENIGDQTPGTDWVLRAWWKFVMRMWNRAAPAPEYQLGWGAKNVVGAALSRILDWDFERVVIAHGDLIEHDAKAILRSAWARPLRAIESNRAELTRRCS
jgi:hypothetical protein